VLETTRIRKEGYSFRPTFEEFLDWLVFIYFSIYIKIMPLNFNNNRYKYLSPDLNVSNTAESCAHILNSIGIKNWRLGYT
jgi:myosin heavy subunit